MMALTLKEKLAAKKAAEAAAKAKESVPAAPKLPATLSEPPQKGAAKEEAAAREASMEGPVQPQPKKAHSSPPPAPAPSVAPEELPSPADAVKASPPAKVVFPRMLRDVKAAPDAAHEDGPARKASPPPIPQGTPEVEEASAPGIQVSDDDLLSASSGGLPAPASLAGVDLAALDEPDKEKMEDEPTPPRAAPVKAEPPKVAPKPAPDKVQRRQRNFVEGEEQPLSQGFQLEHVESVGTAAARFILRGHGVEKEIVLARKKAESLKLDTEDGEYSLNLLYKERNEEGALVVHSEIEGESKLDKAKEKTAKAAKAAGTGISALKHYALAIAAAPFIPAWSIVLATRDWFRQTSESHGNWPMVGVFVAVGVQVALLVWYAVNKAKERKKVE